MAKSSFPLNKVIGLALLIIGAGLVYWGFQMSESLGSQLTESISGSMPDEVMYRYIGGAAGIVVGLFLLFKK